MKTLPVNKPTLVKFMNLCLGVVKYRYGAKVKLGTRPYSETNPNGFKEIDCSGFTRWIIHLCSGRIIPHGSWYQRVWFKEQGFKQNPYRSVASLKDNRLRIAFIDPKKNAAGHVFLIINGKTIESYGGKGVGRRAWYTPGLLFKTKYCFTLTDILKD